MVRDVVLPVVMMVMVMTLEMVMVMVMVMQGERGMETVRERRNLWAAAGSRC